MNYNLLEKTILLFWDQADNFNKPTTQQKIGKDLFQDVIRVNSISKVKKVLERTPDENQKFLFFVHLFNSEENKGYYLFKSSGVPKEFPNMITYLISSAPKKKIYENGSNEMDVFSYENFHEKIGSTFIPQTKKEILSPAIKDEIAEAGSQLTFPRSTAIKIDFAIITALYTDEFEEVEKLFDWTENEDILTNTKRYRIGHLKNMPDKKVVAAVPSATGMVDAAIIATQMLDFFKPKYLLMSGVCGGNEKTNLGDIVLAKKIFTFQKGKISDIRKKDGEPILLYDKDGKEIDYNHLFDETHNQISISVEKFEIEQDSLIEFDSLLMDLIEPKLKTIKNSINEVLVPGCSF